MFSAVRHALKRFGRRRSLAQRRLAAVRLLRDAEDVACVAAVKLEEAERFEGLEAKVEAALDVYALVCVHAGMLRRDARYHGLLHAAREGLAAVCACDGLAPVAREAFSELHRLLQRQSRDLRIRSSLPAL